MYYSAVGDGYSQTVLRTLYRRLYIMQTMREMLRFNHNLYQDTPEISKSATPPGGSLCEFLKRNVISIHSVPSRLRRHDIVTRSKTSSSVLTLPFVFRHNMSPLSFVFPSCVVIPSFLCLSCILPLFFACPSRVLPISLLYLSFILLLLSLYPSRVSALSFLCPSVLLVSSHNPS